MLGGWYGGDGGHIGDSDHYLKVGRDIDWTSCLVTDKTAQLFRPGRADKVGGELPVLTTAGYARGSSGVVSSVRADVNSHPGHRAAATAVAAVARAQAFLGSTGAQQSPERKSRMSKAGLLSPARPSLRDVDNAAWTKSVRECLVPSADSPASILEADRFRPTRGGNLAAEQELDRQASVERLRVKEQAYHKEQDYIKV